MIFIKIVPGQALSGRVECQVLRTVGPAPAGGGCGERLWRVKGRPVWKYTGVAENVIMPGGGADGEPG